MFIYCFISDSENSNDLKRTRSKRSLIQYGVGWPPQSYENTIEVLVVVDGSMVHFHQDDVKFYVLSLMKVVKYQKSHGYVNYT